MVNPFAIFDILGILSRIEKQLFNASESEIHLLAYLGCLLSIYRKQPAADWEYSFVCTRYGIPFSSEISNSLSKLVALGSIKEHSGYYNITTSGNDSYHELLEVESNVKRLQFLEAACSSILALPIGIIREALVSEPSFATKKNIGSTRPLFDDSGVDNLYAQFSAISEALGIEMTDLMVPAVVWLSYLSKVNASE